MMIAADSRWRSRHYSGGPQAGKLFVVDSVAHYPRLTTDEMKALANRIADGQMHGR